MTHKAGATVDERSEEIGAKLLLTLSADRGSDLIPEGGEDKDVLECVCATKLLEQSESPALLVVESRVGDALDVHDPGELSVRVIPW